MVILRGRSTYNDINTIIYDQNKKKENSNISLGKEYRSASLDRREFNKPVYIAVLSAARTKSRFLTYCQNKTGLYKVLA